MFINIHTHKIQGNALEILNLEETNADAPYFSVGVHPNKAHQTALDWDAILKKSQDPNCLAIGECGLDKIIDTPLPDQRIVFEKQIEMSESQQMPIILHCVKAWNEVLQIKKERNPKQTWIFHGFRKTALLESVLDNQLMISIGTALIYDQKLQAIFNSIPIDQLFLETDSDDRFSIEEVYHKAAELKGIPLEELKSQISANFERVFTKFTPQIKKDSF